MNLCNHSQKQSKHITFSPNPFANKYIKCNIISKNKGKINKNTIHTINAAISLYVNNIYYVYYNLLIHLFFYIFQLIYLLILHHLILLNFLQLFHPMIYQLLYVLNHHFFFLFLFFFLVLLVYFVIMVENQHQLMIHFVML